MKILFTGGGTGGHIFPIIAVTREIRRLAPKDKLEFFYLGPKDEFGEVLLSQEGIEVKTVLTGKIRRYFELKSLFENLIDILFKIPIGILQAFFYIFFLVPDVIFSKGGFGSLPGVLAGWLLGVPIFLHESDAIPGLANRLLSKFSLEIFVSFPKTLYFPVGKIILVGNPIRRELLEGSKEEAKNVFKLSGLHPPTTRGAQTEVWEGGGMVGVPAEGWAPRPVILILGGSQGAQRINDKISIILPEILASFELIHQTGEKNFEELKAQVEAVLSKDLAKYYHPFSFLKEEELKKAYAICDLIVSRAGAGSIFEIAALGKPSILIPLPEAAQNHQLKNAYTYAERGAAVILEEENFTPHFFLEKLKYLFSHPTELEKMSSAAKEFAKPLAAKVMASYILSYLTS